MGKQPTITHSRQNKHKEQWTITKNHTRQPMDNNNQWTITNDDTRQQWTTTNNDTRQQWTITTDGQPMDKQWTITNTEQ